MVSFYPNNDDDENDSCSPEMFAYKSIDQRKIGSPDDLYIAATELATEAKMLSSLDHENIIKLRGVSSERFSESFASGKGGYFLMLDILNETLAERLGQWRSRERAHLLRHRRGSLLQRTRSSLLRRFSKTLSSSKLLSSLSHRAQKDCQNLYQRIEQTTLGIVQGMKYLHEKNIVLRDLKPANIGYENIYNGNHDAEDPLLQSKVKLFDFGMAKKVEECDPREKCGSPRYMAPEVMAKKGYTLAVDVYSFGVILYELCSLKRPFEDTYKKRNKRRNSLSKKSSVNEFYDAVAEEGLKPSDNLEQEVCCPRLCSLIEACWDHDPSKRPTFDQILVQLKEIFSPDLFENNHSDNKNSEGETEEVSSLSISGSSRDNVQQGMVIDIPSAEMTTTEGNNTQFS